MKIYIAARFSRRPECNELAHKLQAQGHVITSRWVKPDSDHVTPTGLSAQAADRERERFAIEDTEDVAACDLLVSLQETPRNNSRGGRHVELGMAIGMGKLVACIGPRETVFHHMPQVRHFDTVDQFLEYIDCIRCLAASSQPPAAQPGHLMVPFLIDGKLCYVECLDAPTLTASAIKIKVAAGIPGCNQLMHERDSAHDDALCDSEAIPLARDGSSKFYSVPPATYAAPAAQSAPSAGQALSDALAAIDEAHWLSGTLAERIKALISEREAAVDGRHPVQIARKEVPFLYQHALSEVLNLGYTIEGDDLCPPVSGLPVAQQPSFQERVSEWVVACFGEEVANNVPERNYRFLEESLELVQALGCTQDSAHKLVDYVFGRPPGEPAQEVGGVMTTLAALCRVQGIDVQKAAFTELTRCWTVIERIREKQKRKKDTCPLPGIVENPEDILQVAHIESPDASAVLTLTVNDLPKILQILGPDVRTCAIRFDSMTRAEYNQLSEFEG